MNEAEWMDGIESELDTEAEAVVVVAKVLLRLEPRPEPDGVYFDLLPSVRDGKVVRP